MTALELIEWLKTQAPDATVYIHDADTQWYLRLHTGPDGSQFGSKIIPEDGIAVHGTYGDVAP